jgi:hypothetical protein
MFIEINCVFTHLFSTQFMLMIQKIHSTKKKQKESSLSLHQHILLKQASGEPHISKCLQNIKAFEPMILF